MSVPGDRLHIERGANVPDAELAVVVMAINGDARAQDAAMSLMTQDVPTEIAVVNSGGGSLRRQFTEHLDHLILIEAETLRLPGGTRNLGIAATRAQVVAFLAADCLAPPGWARARLDAHRRGDLAVASALRPAPDASGNISSTSWATYALLHVRRAPEFPKPHAARYGASYDRSLFISHGPFREDLRIGEDTEFNERIAASAPLAWAPDVVTLHRYPTTMREGITQACDRGSNLYAWFERNGRHPLLASVKRGLGNWQVAGKLARLASGEVRQALRRASPLIALFALAYVLGAVAAAISRRTADKS